MAFHQLVERQLMTLKCEKWGDIKQKARKPFGHLTVLVSVAIWYLSTLQNTDLKKSVIYFAVSNLRRIHVPLASGV